MLVTIVSLLILISIICRVNTFQYHHHHHRLQHRNHNINKTTKILCISNNVNRNNTNKMLSVFGRACSSSGSISKNFMNTAVAIVALLAFSLPVFALDINTTNKDDIVIANNNIENNDSIDETTTTTTTTDDNKSKVSINEKLLTLLKQYEEDLASYELKQQNEPKVLMDNIKKKYSNRPVPLKVKTLDELKEDREKVLTLKAYLDEAERDLFQKNWDNLQVYLYTFADQENAFANLIDSLFPSNDKLDRAAREALSFEAKSMFLALDDLREAAKLKQDVFAQKSYAKLLVSYDRFLKAGDLYPTYDPITSTAVFFEGTPTNTLRYDATSKVQVLDTVLLTSGPDMGKTGTIINIDGNNAVVKLDKDGKAYQEVKYVKINMLAKTLDDNNTSKNKNTKTNKKLKTTVKKLT